MTGIKTAVDISNATDIYDVIEDTTHKVLCSIKVAFCLWHNSHYLNKLKWVKQRCSVSTV